MKHNPQTTEHMLRQRLIRIETKLSKLMEHFGVPVPADKPVAKGEEKLK